MQKALELCTFFPHARTTFKAPHPDCANLPGKALPRLLFQRRRALRLTKRQVAERLGVHVEMVGKWERGENAPRAMYHPAIRAFIGQSAWDKAHTHLPPLTRYRLKCGWSQAKLAAALGVSERSVGRWERCGATLDALKVISAAPSY